MISRSRSNLINFYSSTDITEIIGSEIVEASEFRSNRDS